MKEFTKAIGHDLRGSHVLLQHIGHIRPFWTHGLPSTNRQRHQLYVGDLRPRLAKDLKRVQRLIAFVDAEVQVFCHRVSHIPHRDNSVTTALLKQLQTALQHLLNQIDSLPTNKPTALEPEPEPGEDEPRGESVRFSGQQHQTSQDRSILRREQATRDKARKRVHFGGLQAQKISLIRPEQAPAIVTQCRHVRGTCDQPRCQCLDKIPSPILRVDSAMSIR